MRPHQACRSREPPPSRGRPLAAVLFEREQKDVDGRSVECSFFDEHTYPGSRHLFADPDLPVYDQASSEEMWRRALAFLDRVDS